MFLHFHLLVFSRPAQTRRMVTALLSDYYVHDNYDTIIFRTVKSYILYVMAYDGERFQSVHELLY